MFRASRFRLHHKTRRRVCIAGFLACCIAPTALLGLWGTTRCLPGHARSAAAQLSARLGLGATVDRVESPRPGVSRYLRVELVDPETGTVLAEAPRVEVASTWSETPEHGRARLTVVTLAEARLSAEAAGHAGRIVGQLMAPGAASAEGDVRLEVSRLVLRRPDGELVLRDLNLLVEQRPEGSQTTATFQIGDDAAVEPAGGPIDHQTRADEPSTAASPDSSTPHAPEPVRVRVVRRRENGAVVYGFELDTAGGWMPCALLGLGIPGFDALGPEARFKGYFWAIQSADANGEEAAVAGQGWNGELIGQFEAIELGPLAEEWTNHHVAGRASLTVQSARFRRSRLEQASGILVAGPGTLGRSLLAAARGELGLLVAPWTDPMAEPMGTIPARPSGGIANPSAARPGDPIAYEQLACGVVLDGRGVRLQGRCALGPGVCAATGRQWLLAEPPGGAPLLPVTSWVRAATGGAGPTIPNTPRAHRLARLLPAP